jgi:polyhydroxybutyrate depolymerase
MMTQLIMRHWPEKFAGFAPVGAMESMTEVEPEPDDGYLRNVWYILGEYDIFDASLEEGGINYKTLNNLCDSNKIDYSKKRYYETGIYENTIIRDDNGAPLVRFTRVKNWPHTYSPELSFMIYDEFFARFVRNEDGTLQYLA